MAGNIADSLDLIHQLAQMDHATDHGYISHPYEYGKDSAVPIGMKVMGLYYGAAWANLTDGQFSCLRFTNDGKVMVDASVSVTTVPTVWTQKHYTKVTVSDIGVGETIVNFGFTAKYVVISNDDGANSVYFEYGVTPVAGVNNEIAYQEAFEDQYTTTNVHLVADTGKTASVRIWARS